MKRDVRQIVIVDFERRHPPNKTVSVEVRAGGPLKWVRWDVDSHRHPVLLDLPPDERWLWPVLLGLAGKERRQMDGERVIRMTPTQLAREADLTEPQVNHALAHLLRQGLVRVGRTKTRPEHREGGPDHREGGTGHLQGDYVPTYPRTNGPTDIPTAASPRFARRSAGETQTERLERLESEVSSPEIKDLLSRKRQRLERGGALA